MKRPVLVISLTMVVFLSCAVRDAQAEESDVGTGLPQPAVRWINSVPERQPGSVPAEGGAQGFTGDAQEDEGLPWGVEGAQPHPHLLYVQWGSRGRTVRCESDNNRYAYCPTYTNGQVRLQEQLSSAPCRQYDTWGADGDGSGIWVRNGCRAIFVVRGGGGGWGGKTVTCRSERFRYNRCPAY